MCGVGAAQAKVAAKKVTKQVKKAAPQVGAARKTVRERAGWWGNVRTDPAVILHAAPRCDARTAMPFTWGVFDAYPSLLPGLLMYIQVLGSCGI